MSQPLINKIVSRIYGHKRGWVFTPKDFSDLGSRNAIDVSLFRLMESNIIRRATRGIYYYPMYSKMLNRQISPDVNQVAEVIARKHRWKIMPSGETALNLLGLSNQVPGRYVYFTDGANREFDINGIHLTFRKEALKDIRVHNSKGALLVQSLKALGRERIDDSVMEKLQGKFTKEECKNILKETKFVSGWVYEVIKKICREGRSV